jgi:hypothetical protein
MPRISPVQDRPRDHEIETRRREFLNTFTGLAGQKLGQDSQATPSVRYTRKLWRELNNAAVLAPLFFNPLIKFSGQEYRLCNLAHRLSKIHTLPLKKLERFFLGQFL